MSTAIADFVYNYKTPNGQPASLSFPIPIPYQGIVLELAHEIVAKKMDPIMRMLDAHLGKSQSLPDNK